MIASSARTGTPGAGRRRPARHRPRPGHVGALVGLVAGLVALGPALRPGYLLFYDMVFVPHLALDPHTLGVDGSVPRAVPNDLVVALLSHLAPGWVVQKVLLLGVFALVGCGVGRMMRTGWGAAAAALAASWNPYLGERLAIGHWGFLLGYAVMPHLALAAASCRRGDRHGRLRLAAWTVAMALTGSTGAVLGMLVVLCVLLVPAPHDVRRRPADLLSGVGVFVCANACWWFPFLFVAPREQGDPAGVTAFMSRADTPWGVVGSLLTGGGIWNRGVWFAERGSWVISGVALAAVLAVLAVAASTAVWRRMPERSGLMVAGLLGLVVAVAAAEPGGRDVVTALVTHVPGAGLLRDSQKFVAPWALVVALATGVTVERLRQWGLRVRVGRAALALVSAAILLWPVATLSGMAWGAQGRWSAVTYPAAYTQVARRIETLAPGGVAVFPWTLYRRYAWDGDRVLLDPWQRLVSRPVLVNDDLPLSSQVVRGESLPARAVTDALARGSGVRAALHRAGVRYVLVETDQPGASSESPVRPARLVMRRPGLALYDIGTPGHGTPRPSGAYRFAGLGALGLAVLGVLVMAARELRHPDARKPARVNVTGR